MKLRCGKNDIMCINSLGESSDDSFRPRTFHNSQVLLDKKLSEDILFTYLILLNEKASDRIIKDQHWTGHTEAQLFLLYWTQAKFHCTFCDKS